MAQDELQAVLYDFLYRDTGRIASYYSQIFRGHLSSIEETETARQGSDKSGKTNIGVIAGEAKVIKEKTDALKRIIDPRDIITTDILASLMESNRISSNVDEAPHGALIVAEGTLVFTDRFMLETSLIAFEMTQGRAKTAEEKSQQQGAKILKTLISKITFPSVCLLRTQEGLQLAGTIKDEGMEEPISTYYFKHGTAGLPEVFMIGIKEVPTLTFQMPNTHLLGAAQIAAQFLNTMVFPSDAIMVTPIALFRKL